MRNLSFALLLSLLALPCARPAPAAGPRYAEEYQDPRTAELREAARKAQAAREAATARVRERQAEEAAARAAAPALEFIAGDETIPAPESPEQFQAPFHFPPLSQDETGGCWCFAGVSFFESEVARMTGRRIKLSEMFIIYYEYVEKARRFLRERGESRVSLGSEINATQRMMDLYGAAPAEAYTGLPPGATAHDHRALLRELNAYLKHLKDNELWDEDAAIAAVRQILDRHLGGPPPERFTYGGREMTPKEFLRDVLNLRPEDYIVVMSTLSERFYRRGVFDVPDNWWRSADYYNVPLDLWDGALRGAVARGFTVGLCGDTSEPGYRGERDIAYVPAFDIPPSLVTQEARELRIFNGATTDDHCVHLVGRLRLGDVDWFLVKDSSRLPHPGKFWGYWFYREDYIRLKVLHYMIHKDAAPGLLEQISLPRE